MPDNEQRVKFAVTGLVNNLGKFEILAMTVGDGNGWKFSEEVLRASLELWSGVECFVDHGGWFGGRSVRDLGGVCSDPEWSDEHDGIKLKFEIVQEARIEIDGENIAGIPVACLTRRHCFAEKFLANADRGLDASTLSRDIVDLAFMIEGWSKEDAVAGMAMARTAYGEAVSRALAAVTRKMRDDKTYRKRCIDGLNISEPKILGAGIKALAQLG